MSSSESYSPEASSIDHLNADTEIKVVLTGDIAVAFIKEVKDAIKDNTVSEELMAKFIQYYLVITGSDPELSSCSVVENAAYPLLALHSIELLPILLSSTGPFITGESSSGAASIATARLKHTRTVYSSTVKLLSRYDSANTSEQWVLPYLIIVLTKLLPIALEQCEEQDKNTFLQVLYQNAEVTLVSTTCLLDIVHALSNGYIYHAPLDDLYSAMRTEEEEDDQDDSNAESSEEKSVKNTRDTSKLNTKNRKYPLLSLALTQLLTELVDITKDSPEECQKLARILWTKYLSQHGRPRLTQLKALRIQRQLIIYIFTKVPRRILTELLLAFSKQLVSHIRCCLVGKGQLLFSRNSTKDGKKRTTKSIFDNPSRKVGRKGTPAEDSIQRYRDLCSWVFIASIELSLMVIKACSLDSVIHPYIEICFYYNEIMPPSLRFFPCRIKLLTSMSNLAGVPDEKKPLYIPLLHSIMDMIIESVKPVSSTSVARVSSYADSVGKWRSRIIAENAEGSLSGSLISLDALLLCPKELVNTLICRKTMFYESINLFCANIKPYIYHPAFPELMYKPVHYLKHLILSMKEKENLLGHEYKIHYISAVKPTYMEFCMVLDDLRRAINRQIALVGALRIELRLHTKNLLDGGVPAAMQLIRKHIVEERFTCSEAGQHEHTEEEKAVNPSSKVPPLVQLIDKYTSIKGERTALHKHELEGSTKHKILDSSSDLEDSNSYDSFDSGKENSEDYEDGPGELDVAEYEESELSNGSSIDLATQFDKDIVGDLVLSGLKK